MDFSMPRSTDSSSSACPSSEQHDPEMKPPSALQKEEEGREAEETIALPRHGYHDQHPKNHSSAVSSSSRRFPCRARSISNHHTPDNAYVNVPDNAPHGQLLCCSHPECVKSGRRFRYCRVCFHPAARRNFLKRHGHGVIASWAQLKEEVDEVWGVVHSTPRGPTRLPAGNKKVALKESLVVPLHEEEEEEVTSTNIISKGPPHPAQSNGGVAESVTSIIDSASSCASSRHDQNVDGRGAAEKERLPLHCSSESSPPSKKHRISMNSHDAHDRHGVVDDPANCTILSDPPVCVTWRLDLTTTELDCLTLFRKRPSFENQEARSGWTAKLLSLANVSHHSLSHLEQQHTISGPMEEGSTTRHEVARIAGHHQDRVAPLHDPQTTAERNDDGLARMPAHDHHDSDSMSLQSTRWTETPPQTMRHSISESPHETDFWDNCAWK